MATKRVTIGLSNETSKTVDFEIPEVAGTYAMSVTLTDGTVVNAGNIVVNGKTNRYTLNATLDDGTTITSGTFSTPRLSYMLSYPAKPVGVASYSITRNSGSTLVKDPPVAGEIQVYYGDTLEITATAEEGYNAPTATLSETTVTGNVTATVIAGTMQESWHTLLSTATKISVLPSGYAPTNAENSLLVSGLKKGVQTRITYGIVSIRTTDRTCTLPGKTNSISATGEYQGSGNESITGDFEGQIEFSYYIKMEQSRVYFGVYAEGSYVDLCDGSEYDVYLANLGDGSTVTISKIEQYY